MPYNTPYSGPKYEKRYVDIVPEVGKLCPDCNVGEIKQGKFSPYCGECKCFFVQNGGGFKKAVEPRKETPVLENFATKENQEKILSALANLIVVFTNQSKVINNIEAQLIGKKNE
jgi:hypothetical protein